MRSVLLLAIFLVLVTGASASVYIKVLEVPTIHLSPNSQVNFTVKIDSIGSEGSFVSLTFRKVPAGLNITKPKAVYVFPTQNKSIVCTLRSGSISPGNYSFDVGAVAQGAPYSWRKVNVTVEPAAVSMPRPPVPRPVEPQPVAPQNQSMPVQPSRKITPGPGALVGVLALLAVGRRLLA